MPDPTPMPRHWGRRIALIAGIVIAVPLATAVVVAAIPLDPGDLTSRPDPAPDYAAAEARFAAIQAEEERLGVFAPCRSRLLAHGARADVAVVLFHGLTNCPKQFEVLAERMHAQGANVLVLRAPRHGLANAEGTAVTDVSALDDLTAQELRDYADSAIDIADGLGAERRVMGLSMGGVLTAWVAQNRPDVQRAVVVSPALTLPIGPEFLNGAFRNLLGRLPSIDAPGSDKTGIDHVYKGEATHGLVAMYQLANVVRQEARTTPPAVRSIAVDWNANDNQVKNSDVRLLADDWARNGADVTTYEFPADLGLPHDLIDPAQPTGDVEAVYPVLLRQLGFAP